MPPTTTDTDPRTAELVDTAASVLAGLIGAVERVDHPEIAAEVGRLLNAVCRYNLAMRERASDEPLRAAIAMLSASDP